LLVLRDREETAAAGLGGSQTRQSVRTVTYTRIDRNPPLEASLFELPVGAVERQTGAQAALPPGLTPPILLAKVEPAYTPQANAAKRQGTVVLSLQVGPDGVPRNVTVVRGLGLGLDERAVEAVQKYRFVPAEKDGKPVAVNARVEVNFRLYSPQQ
jgi:TonB family protein